MKNLMPTLLSFLLIIASCSAARGEESTSADIPIRIEQAEVGEWVEYKHGDGRRSRLTVIEKWQTGGDTHFTIANEIFSAKRKRARITEEKVTLSEIREQMFNLGPEDFVTRGEVSVHGRKLMVTVVNYVENGKVVRQSYFSDKIPVYGLVRGINTQAKVKTALSLVDYGFAEDD